MWNKRDFETVYNTNMWIFYRLVDGHEYKAYVREKEQAKREYEEAVSQGRTAAHVATK